MAPRLGVLLMFEGAASEAIDFYLSLFEGAAVEELVRYGPGEDAPVGTVKHARLRLAGGAVDVIDSPIAHGFTFTPASSLVIEEGDREALWRLWERLADGGRVLMPLDRYPFSECFGWVTDRFGVSWQVTAPS